VRPSRTQKLILRIFKGTTLRGGPRLAPGTQGHHRPPPSKAGTIFFLWY